MDSSLSVTLSNHAIHRCAQRAITTQMINDTLKYGELIMKQGVRFYVMLEKLIPRELDNKYKDRIKNIVLLVSKDFSLITAYKEKHAIRVIKRKSKKNLKKLKENKRY